MVALKLITSGCSQELQLSKKWMAICQRGPRELNAALQLMTSGSSFNFGITWRSFKTCCHSWDFLQAAMVTLNCLISGCSFAVGIAASKWHAVCHEADFWHAKSSSTKSRCRRPSHGRPWTQWTRTMQPRGRHGGCLSRQTSQMAIVVIYDSLFQNMAKECPRSHHWFFWWRGRHHWKT